jgi:hypothetical protein
MSKFAAALAALAVLSAFPSSKPAHAQGRTGLPDALNVNVTNTNVPVIVNNSASQPVPVTVANVPSQPLLIQPAQRPYVATQGFSGCDVFCVVQFPTIPEGKMLVIKHLSMVVTDIGGAAAVAIGTLVGTQTEQALEFGIEFPLQRAGNYMLGSTPILAFVGPGSAPRMYTPNGTGASGTITGYLIDVPQ